MPPNASSVISDILPCNECGGIMESVPKGWECPDCNTFVDRYEDEEEDEGETGQTA